MKRKASSKAASKRRPVVVRRPPVARRASAAPRSRVEQERPEGPLVLDADCLLESANELRKELLLRLERTAPISIDASEVERIDTASLQVLVAFTRDCKAAGRAIEWTGVAPALADSARLLDLSSALGLPAGEEAVPA